MDKYLVIHSGKKKFKLLKRGNKKAVRVYDTGAEMRSDVSFYIFNRDCEVSLHGVDGLVVRAITSEGQKLRIV